MDDMPFAFDPTRDLMIERLVDAPAAAIWRAWTVPSELMPWFCPKPWRTTACEIDLRPGGRFRTVMEGPNGERFDGTGCYLEVVPERRLVWTSALGPGFRPQASDMPFTGMILLDPNGSRTRYRAIAVHPTAEDREKHAQMGFEPGWNAALDQLLEIVGGR